MNDIIIQSNTGDLMTTSAAIADGTGNQHKNVIALLRQYPEDFEVFGRVAFETRTLNTLGGPQTGMVALLNEDHATLLITYLRNNDVVRKFKQRLVLAFREAKRALAPQVPQTMAQALRLAAEQAEMIEQQQAQLAAAAPKVEFVDRYVESTGSKGFREVCKLLGAKENAFRDFLAEKKIMYRLHGALTPYADHLDAGRFEVKAGTSEHNGHAYNAARFTPKGIAWVAGQWAAYQMEIEQAKQLVEAVFRGAA